jgi:hypothetical protein
MAEVLNHFFSSIFTRENTADVPEPEPTSCRSEVRDVHITASDVKNKIMKL